MPIFVKSEPLFSVINLMELEIPKRLHQYQIAEELGRGTHGVVYQAIEPLYQRLVTVKLLTPDPEHPDEWRRRRCHSLKAARELNHVNICRLLDFAPFEDSLIAVYEHVDGHTLESELAEGPISLDRFFDLAGQIATGLGYAHENDVTHGNLHPGNIMIAEDGVVKLLDFGLPRLRCRNAGIPPAGYPAEMLPYCSPEEIADDSVGNMADLFSTGVVFYRMLSGILPFSSPDPIQLEEMILHEDPDLKLLRSSGAPSEMILLLESLMSKRKKDRPASARELVITLQSIQQFEERFSNVADDGRRSASPRTYLAMSAVFVVLLILWSLLAGRD
ncbi:MAG TPA: serine/threonine-protein kinase [candidate division Zixibacteria bacterium]|nr:serine/threonine-protein kinase [candidate division Zixibacteria bacterium]